MNPRCIHESMGLRTLFCITFLLVFMTGCGSDSGSATGLSSTLNDTGITSCSSVHQPDQACPVTGLPDQDAETGRDSLAQAGLLVKSGAGEAGFDFTKLDIDGAPLANPSLSFAEQPWSCVRDNVTGLVWEKKTSDFSIHRASSTFAWFNDDVTTNGGNAGTLNGNLALCALNNCNTQDYTAAVNAEKLCGFSDWRVPTTQELRSIVNYGVVASIDTNYFPDTTPGLYWSSVSFALESGAAYAIGLGIPFSGDRSIFKSSARYVRLVRGTP